MVCWFPKHTTAAVCVHRQMIITNLGLWGQHEEGFLCWPCASRPWRGEQWKRELKHKASPPRVITLAAQMCHFQTQCSSFQAFPYGLIKTGNFCSIVISWNRYLAGSFTLSFLYKRHILSASFISVSGNFFISYSLPPLTRWWQVIALHVHCR